MGAKELRVTDFLEFRERPDLANPAAEWDSERQLLLITIETEGNDLS